MMKEVEDMQKFLAEAVTIITAIEQNKDAIKGLGAYATETIDGVSTFLQGNIESLLSMCVSSLTNSWGDALVQSCAYLSKARSVLIEGGFTSEEAYGILKDKKDELVEQINNITKEFKTSKNEEVPKKNKASSKEGGPSKNGGRVAFGLDN